MIREAVSAAPPVLAAPDPVAVRRSNDPGSAKTVRYDLLMQQWQGEEWMRPDSAYQILPMTPKELQRAETLLETIPATGFRGLTSPGRCS